MKAWAIRDKGTLLLWTTRETIGGAIDAYVDSAAAHTHTGQKVPVSFPFQWWEGAQKRGAECVEVWVAEETKVVRAE